jgi:hypothetical protein
MCQRQWEGQTRHDHDGSEEMPKVDSSSRVVCAEVVYPATPCAGRIGKRRKDEDGGCVASYCRDQNSSNLSGWTRRTDVEGQPIVEQGAREDDEEEADSEDEGEAGLDELLAEEPKVSRMRWPPAG